MPLQISSETPENLAKALDASPTKPTYLVVYASLTDGRSWCGDCRNAEPFVNAKFGESGETAKVVYAGQRHEYGSFLLDFYFYLFFGLLRFYLRRDGANELPQVAAAGQRLETGAVFGHCFADNY
jgi:hypothetical protein